MFTYQEEKGCARVLGRAAGVRGWVVTTPMLDKYVLLTWTAITTETGLRMFVDGPRTVLYILVVALMPTLLAFLSGEDAWLHIRVVAEAGFWLIFWLMPTTNGPPGDPSLYTVNIWTSNTNLESSHYSYATLGLSFAVFSYVQRLVRLCRARKD